ncbi:hypothetical protein DXG01_004353, partial [Tephrocybe rancida]
METVEDEPGKPDGGGKAQIIEADSILAEELEELDLDSVSDSQGDGKGDSRDSYTSDFPDDDLDEMYGYNVDDL